MSEDKGFHVKIKHIEDYRFEIEFDKESMNNMVSDETEDIGGSETGPNPSRMLAAATLNCLMASLLFCLRKKRIEPKKLEGEVKANTTRVDGRLRITKLSVQIKPEVDEKRKLESCIDIFEDYCVVTQSIRKGIDVDVEVET